MLAPAEQPSPPPAVAVPAPVAVPPPHDVSATESDRVITERLRAVFGEDYEIAPAQLTVAIATVQGVVTLTGRVETDRQRTVMVGHARATEGVTSVDNQIVLAP
jgi:osmotically-inducible protein OsmY